MKREIIFHDKNGDKTKIEIELNEKNFSMSGETGNGCGQCQDSIQTTPNQQKLIDIWNSYHLNDMNAGTIKQEKLINEQLKKHKISYEYDKALKILDYTSPDLKTLDTLELEEINKERNKIKSRIIELKNDKLKIIEEKEEIKKQKSDGWFIIKHLDIKYFFHNITQLASFVKKELAKKDIEIQEFQEQFKIVAFKTMLYDKHPETGEPYQYGTSWLKRELPKDLWEQVETICKEIETDELERKNKYKGGSWKDLDPKTQALGKFLKMTPKEAEENIEETKEDHEYTAEGIDYIVGTDSEVEEYCIDYLTNDTELYSMWVQDQIKQGNASGIKNIDNWADYVIRSNGYGQVLNRWDGSEHYDSDLEIYVIRR